MAAFARHVIAAVSYAAVGAGLCYAVLAGWTGFREPERPDFMRPHASPATFEIPDRYDFLYHWASDLGPDELSGRMSIHSITLERTACYGTCPVYSVTLGRGGRAWYEGRMFTTREGRFVGRLPLWEFARLAFALERIGFDGFEPEYSIAVTDMPSVIVTVEYADGHRHRVLDYGGQAPPEYWLLTAAIDATVEWIEWTPQTGAWPPRDHDPDAPRR